MLEEFIYMGEIIFLEKSSPTKIETAISKGIEGKSAFEKIDLHDTEIESIVTVLEAIV